jgi:hypothetical protein
MSTEWQDRNEEVLAVAADARLSTDGWWRVNCPFCVMHSGREDRRTSLGIHKDGGYHCFRCHTSGKLNPVPDWIGEGFDEAAPQESTDGPKVFDRPTGYVPLWREPGLTSVVLEPACSGGWFGQRIVVPILRWGEDSVDWLGFVGRLWRKARGDETNYRYPKGMSRELFYEQRRLYEESDEPAIVVEGVFDALPYFGQGVACLGKPTKWQQAPPRRRAGRLRPAPAERGSEQRGPGVGARRGAEVRRLLERGTDG